MTTSTPNKTRRRPATRLRLSTIVALGAAMGAVAVGLGLVGAVQLAGPP